VQALLVGGVGERFTVSAGERARSRNANWRVATSLWSVVVFNFQTLALVLTESCSMFGTVPVQVPVRRRILPGARPVKPQAVEGLP
jgi:hypothetical protein